MGFFDVVSGLADGSLLDDTLKKFDQGLDRVEGAISTGIDKVDEVSAKAEQGAEKVIGVGDKAVQATNGLAGAGASSDDDEAEDEL